MLLARRDGLKWVYISGIPLPNIMLVLNPCGPFTSSKTRVLRFVSFSPKVKGAMTALITWHDCFAPLVPKNQLIGNWISSSHVEDGKKETYHDLMLIGTEKTKT